MLDLQAGRGRARLAFSPLFARNGIASNVLDETMIRLLAAWSMLLMLPTAAQAAPKARATITLTSHRFTPSPIYLAAGIPVRMIFLNHAGKNHEFASPPFFSDARLIRGRAPGGVIRLGPGRTAVVDLVPVRGIYKVQCGHFGHRMLGMSTMIIVL